VTQNGPLRDTASAVETLPRKRRAPRHATLGQVPELPSIHAPAPAPLLSWRITRHAVRPDGDPEVQENPRVTVPSEHELGFEQGIWLTQEAHDRLKAELDQLVANRPAMAAEINARREEGDLKENGGYHAAKDEQGKQERRIRQLSHILHWANVGDAPTEATHAAAGTVITIRFQGDDETEKFLLGSQEFAGITGLTVYSPESALGAAVLGSAPGATVTYQAPNGGDITVAVVAVEPFVP
jgi:transcription elongation factor GreA